MFKDTLEKLKVKFIKGTEANNKKKIENLLVFLTLLIITIISINVIWGEDKEKTEEKDNINSYKQLAQSVDNNINSNIKEGDEYNLEQSLEDILCNISGVGKVKVLITYSQSSEIIAMYNETYTSSSTKEEDTNGGTREIEEVDSSKEIIFEDKDGTKTPITQKVVMPKMEGAIVTAEGARKYKY